MSDHNSHSWRIFFPSTRFKSCFFFIHYLWICHKRTKVKSSICKRENHRQQSSNLRRRSPTDFKPVSLTTRTYRLVDVSAWKTAMEVFEPPKNSTMLMGFVHCFLFHIFFPSFLPGNALVSLESSWQLSLKNLKRILGGTRASGIART